MKLRKRVEGEGQGAQLVVLAGTTRLMLNKRAVLTSLCAAAASTTTPSESMRCPTGRSWTSRLEQPWSRHRCGGTTWAILDVPSTTSPRLTRSA